MARPAETEESGALQHSQLREHLSLGKAQLFISYHKAGPDVGPNTKHTDHMSHWEDLLLCIYGTIKMKRQRHGNQVTQPNPGRLPNAPSAPPFSAWKSWNVRPETKTRIPNLPEMDPIAKAVGRPVLHRDLEPGPDLQRVPPAVSRGSERSAGSLRRLRNRRLVL